MTTNKTRQIFYYLVVYEKLLLQGHVI